MTLTFCPQRKPGDSQWALTETSCFAGVRPLVSDWGGRLLHKKTLPGRRAIPGVRYTEDSVRCLRPGPGRRGMRQMLHDRTLGVASGPTGVETVDRNERVAAPSRLVLPLPQPFARPTSAMLLVSLGFASSSFTLQRSAHTPGFSRKMRVPRLCVKSRRRSAMRATDASDRAPRLDAVARALARSRQTPLRFGKSLLVPSEEPFIAHLLTRAPWDGIQQD